MNKRILTWLLAIVMIVASVSVAAAETVYPIPDAGDVTIDWWLGMNSNVSAAAATMNEIPLHDYLEEEIGVKINFIHPTGNTNEAFSVMLAGGDLPDIVESNYSSYPGGLEAAMDAGFVLDIAQYADLVPNYMALLESNPLYLNQAKTVTGRIPGFSCIRGDGYLLVCRGMIVRQDWLDELGLEAPETIDDWTNLLIAFRDQKGATTPLITCGAIPDIIQTGDFVGAFGASNTVYIDNGVVKYGRMEPAWKSMIELFHSWYEEGLFTDTFITDTGAEKNAHILNGDGGAFYGYTGSGIGVLINNARLAGDEVFNLKGVRPAVVNAGETPEFGNYENPYIGTGITINPKSENVELCLKVLDYGYTQQGFLTYNFGREGVDYDMVDGEPIWNETVTANADGLSLAQAIARVARSCYSGPMVQAKGYMTQYAALDCQKDAITTWMDTNAGAHMMPSLSIPEAVADEYSSILTELNSFTAEYTSLAIAGDNDLDDYEEEYLAVLDSIGVARYLEILQAAYDEYLAR